ncbi:FCD domain-containing protein [Oricola sp.]|uniref:GntR family transcriptional regulator n=1 Tax=Oricola sp. TaxID=1979950 RepID=UPI0025CBA3C8|nr:FCD domain-containing protein [Oricola sp.]MCI5074842.1 FCD domain-containing protein [Oricola sp.]
MNVVDSKLPEKTIAERAYRTIRDDIVSGILKPGEKLKIDTLRQHYGFGAAPLREALSRLSGDHLVQVMGQRGFVVAPISPRDAAEIGDLRKLLEVEALARSIPRGDLAWEERLITSYHRLSRLETGENQGIDELDLWEKHNSAFHDATVAACDSMWLLRLREQLFRQHERYRRFSRIKSVRTRHIHEEHEALFEAAMARDVDKAVGIISTHIQRTTEAVVAALDERGGA